MIIRCRICGNEKDPKEFEEYVKVGDLVICGNCDNIWVLSEGDIIERMRI